MSTKSISRYICFYLIVPSNFKNKNVIFLNYLDENDEYFNIAYIKVDNRYDKSYIDLRITKQASYKFSLDIYDLCSYLIMLSLSFNIIILKFRKKLYLINYLLIKINIIGL